MSEVTSLLPGGRDLMNFLMKAIRTKTMTVNPTEMATSKTSSFMFEKESPRNLMLRAKTDCECESR